MRDVPVSVAMRGLVGDAGGVVDGAGQLRGVVGAARGHGIDGVQLDATARGVRPRELDRSSRRGVASEMRRAGLVVSGVDVFVPTEHFVDREHVDRAVGAVLGAIELAADLREMGEVVHVALSLPEGVAEDVCGTIVSAGEKTGVSVADFGGVERERSRIGVGVDPAVVLASERASGFGRRVAGLGDRLVSARLTDWDGASAMRVAAGRGMLDLVAYHGTLATIGYRGHAVIDLRGVGGGLDGAGRVAAAWRDAGPVSLLGGGSV